MATSQEGKAAPAFTLEDARGKTVSLADFAGRNVILYFYPKDDTPGCTKEACGFRDAWKEIGKLDAVVLGVSADGAASHQKFSAKYKLPFPLLSDPDRQAERPWLGGGADSGARDQLVFGGDVALELGHHLGGEEPQAALGDLVRHATVAEDAVERLGARALLDVEDLLVALLGRAVDL